MPSKTKIKQFIREVRIEHDSRIADSLGGGVSDFTGATSIAGGASGRVPAPQAGDNEKFLSGKGSWENFTLSTLSSTVEGAMWLDNSSASNPRLAIRVNGTTKYIALSS